MLEKLGIRYPAGVKYVWSWFVTVCMPASIPFVVLIIIGVLAVRLRFVPDAPYLPMFERLTGLGQLIPTGLALLGSGLRELTKSKGVSHGRREKSVSTAWTFGICSMVIFAGIQVDLILSHGSVPYGDQRWLAVTSLLVFGLCALLAANFVYVSIPAAELVPEDETTRSVEPVPA